MSVRVLRRVVCAVFTVVFIAACAGLRPADDAVPDVPELRPGILQGYLPMEPPYASVEFVPAAPAADSARQRLDDAISRQALALRDTPRWDLAVRDAHLSFPAAAGAFSCALGLPVNERDTPALYMLLRRTLADIGLATYSAKNTYRRPRPFMLNGEPTCTPHEDETLRHDGSYPSGHTAIGWGWALILAELAPQRAEKILARGRAFGESRLVCNVHWYSDVVAGRMVAAGAVARLHGNAQFNAALRAAATEMQRVRPLGLVPDVDCVEEQQALSLGL